MQLLKLISFFQGKFKMSLIAKILISLSIKIQSWKYGHRVLI